MEKIDKSNTNRDLFGQIDGNQCTALNVEGNGNVKGVFSGSTPVLSNKGDPELIIYVKFIERVSLTGIRIESGMERDAHPEIIQLYANNNNLDFGDIESITPSESIKVTNSNYGALMNLKIAKFKNIDQLAVNFNFYFLF